MNSFDQKISEYYKLILEQDVPPPPPTGASAAPDAGSGMAPPSPSAGGMAPPPPDAGGSPGGQGVEDMENEVKRDADPREYTRSILALLVDKKEGVTPEMFEDFIDSVSLAITKIKDKEGLKQFYGNFYRKLVSVLELRDELKSMFRQLSGTLEDLSGTKEEPNDAGGGKGMAGPSGPGVE